MPSKTKRRVPRTKIAALEQHVTGMWPKLIRSTRDALEAVRDVKLASTEGTRWPLYVSASEDPRRVRERLRKTLEPAAFHQIDIRILSGAPEQITEHGLVYLPGRYVVPGGRFNEMYGWDSYFIARGLLREGRVGLAESIADQQLYQVKHYGTVLNCNRTYCLTRSHPPFLGRLVLAVFEENKDIEWLRTALPQVERYHAYWTSMPQFIPGLGLSRYFALGEGPAPEVLHGEIDAHGRNHYERLRDWLRGHGDELSTAQVCYNASTDSLGGEIGRVEEFYFDDQRWAIRYLVADTGNWLRGRQVLISPNALGAVNKQEGSIEVALTRSQIEESPSLDTDKPVSRQFELEHSGYYGWPPYWSNHDVRNDKPSGQEGKVWNPHLRSTHAVAGYCIEAIDGEIGHVDDFLIDDTNWVIRYLVVDTKNWWPGKKVLVSPQWIGHVSWDESKVFVDLSREQIKRSPTYTSEALVTRDYETSLYGHYRHEGYWADEASGKKT